jgi:hypothetical protein
VDAFVDDIKNYENFGTRSENFDTVVNAVKYNVKGKPRNFFLPPKCLGCRALISYLLMRRRLGDRKENIARTAIITCRLVTSYSQQFCEGIVNLNIDPIIFIMDARPQLTSKSVCALVLQGECGDLDESLDFKLNISPIKKSIESKKSNNINNTKIIKILHFSDLHYDPDYLVGGNANCNDPLCCRKNQGVPKNKKDRAGYWGDYRNCDTPWHVVENSIRSAVKQHPDADIIYYTGDFVPHNVWETSVSGNIELMERTYQLFREVFVNKSVYSILGNHEGGKSAFQLFN